MPNRIIYRISIAVLAIIGCFQLFTFSKKAINFNFDNETFYAAKSHNYNFDVNFCGEKIPLGSKDILERFDKEIIKNTYWHSSILLFYKRSGKYFPIIEPILKKHGIPNDFKYLAIAESGLKNVVSPAGARGFWQFMEKTGLEYNLEINKEVDERYHLEKATEAACKYFKEAYAKFNSWTLVAASYNMGMYGLQKNLTRQKTNNYFDLLLNSETSRYVFRIAAFKAILENPKHFGFNLNDSHRYAPMQFKTITVDTSISNLTDFAINQNINYKLLKIANPWLRNQSLKNANSKRYLLKIPSDEYLIHSELNYTKPDSVTVYADSTLKTLCIDSLKQITTDTISQENSINSDSLKIAPQIEKSNQ